MSLTKWFIPARFAFVATLLCVAPVAFGFDNDADKTADQIELNVADEKETVDGAIVELSDADEVEATANLEKGVAMIDENGTLHGFVFRVDGDQKVPVAAKITITADGKVIESASTDESGIFSIANVKPGSYSMFAAADDAVATQTYDVLGYSNEYSGTTAVNMSVGAPIAAAPTTVYDNFGSMPVSSFSSAAPAGAYGGGCGSCGGGFGGGGGYSAAGGRGLRRLLIIGGIVGGVVAIASDPASPDN